MPRSKIKKYGEEVRAEKTRWASVILSKELSERLDKIIVNTAVKLGVYPFGIKTVILSWALEEWLEKYENDPEIHKKIVERM